MILTKYKDTVSRYKDRRSLFSIYENASQIIFALFAALNLIWGCIAVEILTIILVLLFRPFYLTHSYVLTLSENILVICSNLIAEYYEGLFSVSTVIALIICATIPLIASYYVYIFKDYGKPKNEWGFDEFPIEYVIVLFHIVLCFGGLFWGVLTIYLPYNLIM